jgi:hypothetical protein
MHGIASPNSSSIVTVHGYRSDLMENTIPMLMFTVSKVELWML